MSQAISQSRTSTWLRTTVGACLHVGKHACLVRENIVGIRTFNLTHWIPKPVS